MTNRFFNAMMLSRPLSESSGNVIACLLIFGVREHFLGRTLFQEIAHQHESGPIRDAAGLLDGMGNDDDRVVLLELHQGLFDLIGRNRVQRRARAVQEDYFGTQGQDAGDA
jgi:hypothetical protein